MILSVAWRALLLGLAGGFAGVLFALMLWTAYVDHQRVTMLWAWAAQVQAAAPPAPSVTAPRRP